MFRPRSDVGCEFALTSAKNSRFSALERHDSSPPFHEPVPSLCRPADDAREFGTWTALDAQLNNQSGDESPRSINDPIDNAAKDS
jgi:hypothetical protein